MVRLLSYPLAPDSPTYVGTPAAVFTPGSRIERGDTSNWVVVTTQNHASTHVDGPWHFNPNGRRITEIDPGEFLFEMPRLVDIPKSDDEVVTAADLRTHGEAIRGADMLLIRTGYGARWRSADPERYRHHSPGFDVSAGRYLVDEQPALRAVAMDVISAACQAHVDEGREFHRIMLGRRRDDRYVFLVEDARIDPDLAQVDLGRVIMAPLLLEGQDGGPVTLLAETARP